jgi:hypothetical protein
LERLLRRQHGYGVVDRGRGVPAVLDVPAELLVTQPTRWDKPAGSSSRAAECAQPGTATRGSTRPRPFRILAGEPLPIEITLAEPGNYRVQAGSDRGARGPDMRSPDT